MDQLTDKQRRFVEEYCSNGFNATQAAITAGYSVHSARQGASDTLAKQYIQDAIQLFMQAATDRALVTIEDVVNGLLTEAQCNGEGSSQSARVSAWKALSDYTGGFDANTKKIEISTREELTPWGSITSSDDE